MVDKERHNYMLRKKRILFSCPNVIQHKKKAMVLTDASTRIGSIKSIKELPPVSEPWEWEELLNLPVHETDRLYALLKTKIEIVQDIYQLQISYKERLEARKDKQVSILGPFNDGR